VKSCLLLAKSKSPTHRATSRNGAQMNNRILWLPNLVAVLGTFATPNAFAQTAQPTPAVGPSWYTPLGYVPASSTAVTPSTSMVNFLYLANTSASPVTVTLTDSSTACSGSPCPFWPAVTIAGCTGGAGVGCTVYTASLGGLVATGGVKWSASTGNAVVGFMTGTYPGNLIGEEWPLPLDGLFNWVQQWTPGAPAALPVTVSPPGASK